MICGFDLEGIDAKWLEGVYRPEPKCRSFNTLLWRAEVRALVLTLLP
jgi:hypothetical protein